MTTTSSLTPLSSLLVVTGAALLTDLALASEQWTVTVNDSDSQVMHVQRPLSSPSGLSVEVSGSGRSSIEAITYGSQIFNVLGPAAQFNAGDVDLQIEPGVSIRRQQSAIDGWRGFAYLDASVFFDAKQFVSAGPSLSSVFAGSGGTPGLSYDTGALDIYRGGDGGDLNIGVGGVAQISTFELEGLVAGSGYGLAGSPDASVLYFNSAGGNGGSYSSEKSLDAGDGGDINVSITNTQISFDSRPSTGAQKTAIWNGLTASSVGGQAGMYGVWPMKADNGPDTTAPLGLPTWDMGFRWQNTGDSGSGYLSGWNGTGVPGNYGSSVSLYGQNGQGGDINIAFLAGGKGNTIQGYGDNLTGVSANSIGGAIQLPKTIGGAGGYVYDAITMNYYLAPPTANPDPNNPNPSWNSLQPFPGAGGNVSVSLEDLELALTGSNLAGVVATSSALPFFNLTNVKYFKNMSTGSGDVTVITSPQTRIELADHERLGISFGILAVSTSGALANPFSESIVIDDKSIDYLVLDPFFPDDLTYDPPFGVGRAGKVLLDHKGQIVTTGQSAVGLAAISAANNGAVGAVGNREASGGRLYNAEQANEVTVLNTGVVTVMANEAIGVVAASVGSGGLLHGLANHSENAIATFIHGAAASAKYRQIQGPTLNCLACSPASQAVSVELDSAAQVADGNNVSFSNEAQGVIQVGNPDRSSRIAYGVIAQSIGHGGGTLLGGAAKQVGSDVEGGGDGATVSVKNYGSVATVGDSGVGILVQSIGGGGGAGANSDSLFVALGGTGASGGDGGSVTIDFYEGSTIVTNGDYAVGLLAHSIGGGGGHGGASKSVGIFGDVAIGGKAGIGGDAGSVSITSSGHNAWTAGQHAHGVLLQAIGGGGGTGGAANSHAYGLIFAVSVSTGGVGGKGGAGGTIQGGQDGYNNAVYSRVTTNAHDSSAIILQSIGAGGGVGGASTAKSVALGLGTLDPELAEVPAIGVATALGGEGGIGGAGGNVKYWHVGDLSTYGNNSHAIHAQSIGGGGGSGGDGTASSQTVGAADLQLNLGFGLGGNAATGSDGGLAWVRVGPWNNDDNTVSDQTPTTIRTVGHQAIGVLAQSIGGGGGDAGTGSGLNLSVQFTPESSDTDGAFDDADQGVDDGADDIAGDNAGDQADGSNTQADAPSSETNDLSNANSLQNHASSNAGELPNAQSPPSSETSTQTNSTGSDKTMFASAMTCLKKIVGTGDIAKSLANCDAPDGNKPGAKTVTLDINVGRPGGGSGVGANAIAFLFGRVFTAGTGSHGVFAQSVGGGGGRVSAAGADASGGTVNATINVGAQGGAGGKGGSVTAANQGVIATGQLFDLTNPTATDPTEFNAPAVIGGDAHGVFGQSIGGGGGHGGHADPSSSSASSAIVDLINGKYGTAALQALGVSQADISDINAGRALLKWGLLGKPPTSFSFSPTVNVGGAGGTGGDGGDVTVSNTGSIRTFGHRSYGVFGQSIGGGGGTAGAADGALIDLSGSETLSGISFNPSVNVGGAGGAAGDGGTVSFTDTDKAAAIVTRGYASHGIFLQSVGGGGGVAHEGSTFGLSDTVGLDGNVSVTGGIDFGGGKDTASYTVSAGSASASGSIAFGSADMKNGKQTARMVDRNKMSFATATYADVSRGNSGAGGDVSFGSQTSPVLGTVTTHGDDAHGLFGQSIGGGGGLASMGCTNSTSGSAAQLASACWGNTNTAGNGQPSAFVGAAGTNGVAISVNGGNNQAEITATGAGRVAVYTEQQVTTFGQRSMGIVAQAITGGGGFYSGANRRIHSVAMPTQQRAIDASPGDMDIHLSSSTITTHGDGAWGVLAQMVQGGGGLFGDPAQDLAFNVKSSQLSSPTSDVFRQPATTPVRAPESTLANGLLAAVDKNQLPARSTQDVWQNNPLTLDLRNSRIQTQGTNAHGVFAQNLGSVGGIWSSSQTKLNVGITLVGNNAYGNSAGGKVNVNLTKTQILVTGKNARGLVVQSDGAGPGGQGDHGKITVNVTDGSTITSIQHTALMLVGGSFDETSRNQISVNESAIVSGQFYDMAHPAIDDSDAAYNGWAIYAPTGYTNINNASTGHIQGNILLGITTQGDFNNHGTWIGSTFMGASESLHNFGEIYAGGQGTTNGLYIDGSLKHHSIGLIYIDIDPVGSGADSDLIVVKDLARIEGLFVPQAKSLLPLSYPLLSAGQLEYSGDVRDTHLFNWNIEVNDQTLINTVTADFTPQGYALTQNQAALAGYFQRSWDASTTEHATLFGYLHEHELGKHASYQATLDELMGQTLNTQPIQFQTAFSTYMSQSLSCPTVTKQGLRLKQDDCAWAKVTGAISDQSSNSSNPGFRSTGGGIRLGAQKRLRDGWTAGFAAGYALNYLTSTNFSSNGQFFDLSVSAKKQIEQWEFGGSLGFAQGWFQNSRYRNMGVNGAAAPMDGVFASDSRMSIMGLRLRAAFELELQKDHYLKPYVDVDLSYSSMPGYSETGTAPLALTVGSTSRWNVAITPMLEYGLDVVTANKTRVKLFASAGASFLPNNSHKSETSFVGSSAALGTFDVITDGPEMLGRLNLGIQVFQSDSLEVRAQYGLLVGDGYWSQDVSANLVWRF